MAAYFSFADAVENKRAPDSFVRIYAITGAFLHDQSFQNIAVAGGRPYIGALTVSPRHNPRLYAQQGKFLVTNIVDLENYMLLVSQTLKRDIVFAADVPAHCAFAALQDLKYMGLTAGSLFPGLDGVSKMIKQMMMVSDTKHQLELLPKDSASLADQTKLNADAQ